MRWSTISLTFPLTNGAERFVCSVNDVRCAVPKENNGYAGNTFLAAHYHVRGYVVVVLLLSLFQASVVTSAVEQEFDTLTLCGSCYSIACFCGSWCRFFFFFFFFIKLAQSCLLHQWNSKLYSFHSWFGPINFLKCQTLHRAYVLVPDIAGACSDEALMLWLNTLWISQGFIMLANLNAPSARSQGKLLYGLLSL